MNGRALLDESCTQKILARGVDAIVSFIEVEKKALNLIKQNNKKILVIGRKSNNGADYLSFNDELGSYLATKHLIEMGHKDILYFSARLRFSCAVDRLNGYKRALSEANIEIKEENIIYVSDTCLNGCDFINEAQNRNLKYTAILSFNDMFAYGAIDQLNNYNKKVPEDVSIIGFDNIESSLHLPVGLTTIDFNKEALCNSTVKKIIKYVKKQKEYVIELPNPKLIIRNTVKKI